MKAEDPLHTIEQMVDAVTRLAGSQAALADRLGVKQQNISYWRKSGVPVEYCAQFEEISGGAVTRKMLRPTEWSRIWPELAGVQQPEGQGV